MVYSWSRAGALFDAARLERSLRLYLGDLPVVWPPEAPAAEAPLAEAAREATLQAQGVRRGLWLEVDEALRSLSASWVDVERGTRFTEFLTRIPDEPDPSFYRSTALRLRSLVKRQLLHGEPTPAPREATQEPALHAPPPAWQLALELGPTVRWLPQRFALVGGSGSFLVTARGWSGGLAFDLESPLKVANSVANGLLQQFAVSAFGRRRLLHLGPSHQLETWAQLEAGAAHTRILATLPMSGESAVADEWLPVGTLGAGATWNFNSHLGVLVHARLLMFPMSTRFVGLGEGLYVTPHFRPSLELRLRVSI
jgi:hypothetical protein